MLALSPSPIMLTTAWFQMLSKKSVDPNSHTAQLLISIDIWEVTGRSQSHHV